MYPHPDSPPTSKKKNSAGPSTRRPISRPPVPRMVPWCLGPHPPTRPPGGRRRRPRPRPCGLPRLARCNGRPPLPVNVEQCFVYGDDGKGMACAAWYETADCLWSQADALLACGAAVVAGAPPGRFVQCHGLVLC